MSNQEDGMSDAVSVLNMVRSVRPEAAGRCIPAE